MTTGDYDPQRPVVDPVAAQREATMAFCGEREVDAAAVPGVECPACRHRFVPGAARRVQETTTLPVADRRSEFAAPGELLPLDTEENIRAAWAHLQAGTAPITDSAELGRARVRTRAALARLDIPVSPQSISEALINGRRSWDDYREMVRRAVRAAVAHQDSYGGYCWISILDINDADVVYMVEGDELWQASYTITGDTVTLGAPVRVERSYSPSSVTDPAPVVERVRIDGAARVLEAKGTDAAGQRIYRVQVIVPGDSKNGRRYPEAVLAKAAPLYEGCKAYDHHRTESEMATGTVQGLVGYHRNVTVATSGAIESDLYVLPSATLIVEALDAALALAAETDDAPPLVGISHDCYASFRPIREGGVQLQEATSIERVFSADVVSDPAAGGRPTRVVAGGIDPTTKEGNPVALTSAEVLEALKNASPEDLASAGLTKTAETAPAPVDPVKTTETVETVDKNGWVGKTMIAAKFGETQLPAGMLAGFVKTLPEKVSEAIVDDSLAGLLDVLSLGERNGLASSIPTQVTKEAHDKKVEALDAFFQGDYSKGYRSLKHAWSDFSGRPRESWNFDEDPNRVMLAECIGTRTYDSTGRARRTSEALTAASWDVVLGDSIHRQMIRMWDQPDLQAWRKMTSTITPISDFRQNKRERIGGYGLLPIVLEQAPYQPLQSPTDEEAVYSVIKRGGTENLTFEMIANDDVNAVREIPRLLGLAAAITLYRYVLDFMSTNVTATYDSTALFHTNHANTDNPAVLSQSTMTAARAKMRVQAGYNNSINILSIRPKTLWVPPALEEIAFQLTKSAVAIPSTPAGPSNTPNLHAGLDMEVVDYWTDANDWYLTADGTRSPLVEMGFYQGRVDPELFTQADPTVGSVFNNDSVTYKIRHIYAGAILDHRGFYRGAN